MIILKSFVSQCMRGYLEAELASGQSVWNPSDPNNVWGLSSPAKFEDFNHLTKVILRISQLATSYDNYFQTSFQAIESIQESIEYISSILPQPQKYASRKIGAILDERLRYIYHEGKSVFWELQSVKARTGAQMNAVNHPFTCSIHLLTMPDFRE